jgi:anti-sigma factor RsiW
MKASPADLTADLPTDLDWLAERFVLGELPPLEEEAVASRLADDDALAAAVARASRLVTVVRAALVASPAAQPAPRPRHGRLPSRWLVVAAGATAAVVAWLAWLTQSPRPVGPPTGASSATLVELWRAADNTTASDSESSVDEGGQDEADTVPEWMLAAVSLDAADGDFEVREN